MDHGVLVYKVDNSVQSSLSSSLVLKLIHFSFPWPTLRSWERRQFKNTQEFWILHGINSPITLILLNILKPSEIMSVVPN